MILACVEAFVIICAKQKKSSQCEISRALRNFELETVKDVTFLDFALSTCLRNHVFCGGSSG